MKNLLSKISFSDIVLIGGGLFIAVVTIEAVIYQLNGGQLYGCVTL